MIEAVLVWLVLVILTVKILNLIPSRDINEYKEGDYVVWFGGLYKVISVEDNNLVIKNIKYNEKHIVNPERSSIKKVSKKFADTYLQIF